jgi:predicted MPP superfamily phosphohydrolase
MFAQYNYDNFPVVFVTFSESINSETEFDQFLNEWLILYHNRQDFSYIFDTRNMKNISPKYAIKMTLFIKNLRKEPYHYLQKSLILVNDKHIKRLLDFVFTLQSPVAPVYLWLNDSENSDSENSDSELNKEYLMETLNTINRLELKDNMIYIKANSSLIPFL